MLTLTEIIAKIEDTTNLTKEEVVFLFESDSSLVLDIDMDVLRESVAEHGITRDEQPLWFRNKEFREAANTHVETIHQLLESRHCPEELRTKLTTVECSVVQGKTRALKQARKLIESLRKCPAGLSLNGVTLDESCFALVPDKNDSDTWQCQIKDGEGKFVESNTISGVLAACGDDNFEVVKNRYVVACANSESKAGGRIRLTESLKLTEALHGKVSNGRLQITLIQPGVTKDGLKFYPREVIAAAVHLYEGVKMFADHPTSTDEWERPERSINDWVATVQNVRLGSGGEVLAEALIIDPVFKAKVELLESQGQLDTLEVSQNALGHGEFEVMEDGREMQVVKAIGHVSSVDFITQGNAGGMVTMLESYKEDIELISMDTLRLRRPDLIELLESKHVGQRKEFTMDLEKEIKGLRTDMTAMQESHETVVGDLTTKLEEANSTIAGLKTDAGKVDAQAAIGLVIKESKLPEEAQATLTESYAHVTDFTDDSKAGLTKMVESMVKLTEGASVKNLGRTDNADNEETEDEGNTKLLESYIASGIARGMSKDDAKEYADDMLKL